MENATKALIMAGGMLIGILILSLAVYLFSTLGGYSASIESQHQTNRVNEFNSQFLIYSGRSDVSVHNVVTMVNSARNNNENYYSIDELRGQESTIAQEANYYIQVIVDSTSYTALSSSGTYTADVTSLLQDQLQTQTESGVQKTYSCTTQISSYTGRVYKIQFTSN